ncbi:GntR family transcriptional regulator [Ideonella sp. A 288]|uniref:GntR family transcriptional regulator n=1 Tax=Ideonella sp. A 288 TaxID=1962181 RepID=UPI000B4B69C4|nr:GntR family transcriptional regulator [Ideonella sp. A 288]
MKASLATVPTPAACTDADIHDQLVAAVMDHRLPPGTKLVEDKLGQVYGVSRTRIRQVLIRLAQSQVVTLSPHRGASIAEPSVDEAHEVFEVRRLIEPTLLRRAIARASATDLDALAALIADEEQARRQGRHPAALRLSGEFHLRLAQLAGHATLQRLLGELVSRTSLVLMTYGDGALTRPVRAARAAPTPRRATRWVDACNCHDHRGLLAAMRRGAADEAEALMLRHLSELEAGLCFAPAEPVPTDLAALLGPGAPVA